MLQIWIFPIICHWMGYNSINTNNNSTVTTKLIRDHFLLIWIEKHIAKSWIFCLQKSFTVWSHHIYQKCGSRIAWLDRESNTIKQSLAYSRQLIPSLDWKRILFLQRFFEMQNFQYKRNCLHENCNIDAKIRFLFQEVRSYFWLM